MILRATIRFPVGYAQEVIYVDIKIADEPKMNCYISQLPERVQVIAQHSFRHVISKVSFFANASPDFLFSVTSQLEFQVYFPGEYIVRMGRSTYGNDDKSNSTGGAVRDNADLTGTSFEILER